MRVRIYTLRWGNLWWVKTCGETLDDYCERNGYDLHVWNENAGRGYPATKFAVIDMLKQFIASGDDWFGYMDSDIFVHADMPPLPLEDWSNIMVRPDELPAKSFNRWLRQYFPSTHVPRSWRNRNAGLWFCDQKAARQLLAEMQPPFVAGLQEQHQWNLWLIRAQEKGMVIGELPEQYNKWWNRNGTACFHHISGKDKRAKFNNIMSKINWDWTKFDRSPYGEGIKGSENMEADDFHVDLLYACTKLAQHRPDGEKIAIEVGSFKGTTTAALLKAVDEGRIKHLHIVEVRPTPELQKRINLCHYPARVTLHTNKSWELEKIDAPDLVFIDGDHKWPALADTLRMITWGAHTIALHDSHAWPEYRGAWGSTMAANMLRDDISRPMWEDFRTRVGMRTHRGFSVAALKGTSFAPLNEVFETLRQVS